MEERIIYQTVEEDDGVEYIHEHETEDEAIQHCKHLLDYARDEELSATEYDTFVVKVTIDEDGYEDKTTVFTSDDYES